MFMPMFYDPYFWVILISIAISSWASINVNSTFGRYADVNNHNNITGAEAAEMILANVGIQDVKIQPISGQLTDNYNGLEIVLSKTFQIIIILKLKFLVCQNQFIIQLRFQLWALQLTK
mgnify:CR=1 FL=1